MSPEERACPGSWLLLPSNDFDLDLNAHVARKHGETPLPMRSLGRQSPGPVSRKRRSSIIVKSDELEFDSSISDEEIVFEDDNEVVEDEEAEREEEDMILEDDEEVSSVKKRVRGRPRTLKRSEPAEVDPTTLSFLAATSSSSSLSLQTSTALFPSAQATLDAAPAAVLPSSSGPTE